MKRHATFSTIVVTSILLTGLLAIGLSLAAAAEPGASAPDEKYLLKEQPKDAADVIAVRKVAKDQADVVVVGRIGGRLNPWIKGTAAFSIVDRSLTPCSEMPGDTCKTPWDYCCETDLPKATLLVMLHDTDGKLVKRDAKQLLGVNELDTVVIQGQAKRDKAGNVSIVASKVYVATDKKETTQ